MPLDNTAPSPPRHSRYSVEAAQDLLSAGAGVIVDPEGNGYDPIGSTQGKRRSLREGLTEVGENVKEKLGSVIGENALNPQAVEQLRVANPQTSAFLSSTSGMVGEAAIFFTYVGLDMAKGLYNSKVLKGPFADSHTFIRSSLILSMGMAQLLLGLITLVAFEGTRGLMRLVNANRFKKFFFVSLLFAFASNFNVLAYTVFLPGTIKILGQCRLLNTAVLSKIIFNRRYLETQWLLMLIIIAGAILHLLAKQQNNDRFSYENGLKWQRVLREDCHMLLETGLNSDYSINRTHNGLQPMAQVCVTAKDSDTDDESVVLGLFYVFSYIMCSDIASIISEMFLKEEKDTPFYIQKITIESMGIPINFITSFTTPYLQMLMGVSGKQWAPQMWWAGGILGGFMGGNNALDWCATDVKFLINHPNGICGAAAGGLYSGWFSAFAPWGALFFSSCQSWMAGILVKLMSSVVKLLAKVVSLGGVFFIGDCWLLVEPGDPPMSAGAAFAAVQVIMLTYGFLTIKTPKEETQKLQPQAQTEESVELQPVPKPDVV